MFGDKDDVLEELQKLNERMDKAVIALNRILIEVDKLQRIENTLHSLESDVHRLR
jgi:hypothetical protein